MFLIGFEKFIELSICRYFPYEDENNHKLVREIGNVTRGTEITFQFAVKPEFEDGKNVLQTLQFHQIDHINQLLSMSASSSPEEDSSVPNTAEL